MQTFGAILLIAAYFAYSLTSLIIYLLMEEGISIILAFGIQNVIMLSLLSLRFIFTKKKMVKPKRFSRIFLRSFTGVLYSLAYFKALTFASFAEVGLLTNSFPLFVVLIAWIFLGEKISVMQWVALIVGMLGVWLILVPNVNSFIHGGIFYATFASVLWAISLIIMQKVTDYEDVYTYLFLFYLCSTLMLMPFIVQQFQMPTQRQMFFYSLAAIISILAQTLMFHAYKISSAAELAPYNYSFAFFHFLLARGLFKFEPTMNFYVGAALVFLGGVINLLIFERRDSIDVVPPNEDSLSETDPEILAEPPPQKE
ncbi:MAG: hypothetical protein S4CHLAM20_12190 [Chlamydiia bacterium]|nr:hypothetical protein [Chlamydiia bacterium]